MDGFNARLELSNGLLLIDWEPLLRAIWRYTITILILHVISLSNTLVSKAQKLNHFYIDPAFLFLFKTIWTCIYLKKNIINTSHALYVKIGVLMFLNKCLWKLVSVSYPVTKFAFTLRFYLFIIGNIFITLYNLKWINYLYLNTILLWFHILKDNI